ncbi:MAG: EVE domain-containing protein [Alphaproteobacteria bacterium]|nr:EVE domain-containing protein [Alphaproteobacteria bacterium]
MNYWLVKTEPNDYSWVDMQKDGITSWSGVRNYQARNNLKTMKKGDLVLFYHSVIGMQVMGIVSVEKEFYPDSDPNFVCVDVKFMESLKNPVSLSAIKANPKLADIALVKHSRLSVMPLKKEDYEEILRMSA